MSKEVALTIAAVIAACFIALGVLQIIFLRRVYTWVEKYLIPVLFWPLAVLNRVFGLDFARKEDTKKLRATNPNNVQLIVGRIEGIFLIMCGITVLVVAFVILN